MKTLNRLLKRGPELWMTTWLGASALACTLHFDYHIEFALHLPNWAHPFGYDAFGRDLLSLVLYSSLRSICFAGVAVSTAILLGIFLGAFLAIAHPWIRTPGLKILEILLAFPSLLVAMAWSAVRGPSWSTLLVSLMIGTLPYMVRFVFVRAREILNEDYILAARSMGANSKRIVTHHLFPSLLSLCAVKIPNLFAYGLIAEATLSFLGIGAPLGGDTWGSLLAQSKDYLIEAPHIAIGTGIPLAITILSLQSISERAFNEKLSYY